LGSGVIAASAPAGRASIPLTNTCGWCQGTGWISREAAAQYEGERASARRSIIGLMIFVLILLYVALALVLRQPNPFRWIWR
jgi:hypothetical protein